MLPQRMMTMRWKCKAIRKHEQPSAHTRTLHIIYPQTKLWANKFQMKHQAIIGIVDFVDLLQAILSLHIQLDLFVCHQSNKLQKRRRRQH